MSRYTMQLRAVCELYGDEEVKNWFMDYNIADYLSYDQLSLIQERLPYWDKEQLAQKCINKYYMREIGFETPYLFKHMLKVRLAEIMEEKLPILYSMAIEYDPLVNVDYTESFTRKIESENTGESTNNETVGEENETNSTSSAVTTSNTSSSGLEVNSDTPQGRISKQDLLAGSWASNTKANENETSGTTETHATDNTTGTRDISRDNEGNYTQNETKDENYTRKMRGNSGVMTTAQKLIQQYRDLVYAFDSEVIKELDVLFFGILN